MQINQVTKEIILQASVETVWRAITDKEEMKRWYFTIDEFIPEPGFQFKLYGERKGIQYPISCTIREVQLNERLSYSWNYDDFPAETLVTFELEAKGAQTLLRFTHEGLEDIPNDGPDTSVRNHADGWDFIIGSSLKQYVEIEAGLPSNF